MKRILKRVVPWGVLLSVAALAVWLLWPASYDAAVPAQAKAVVRIDLRQVDQRTSLLPAVEKWLGFAPQGIEAGRPAYVFITPNEYVGMVVALSDAGAFLSVMEQMQKQKKIQLMDDSDGMHWGWVNQGWLVGWDSRRLVALGPGVAQERDELRQTIVRMSAGREPFTSTKAYERMTALPAGVQLFAQLDALPAPYNVLFRLNVPSDCPREAVQVFASVKSLKGGGWEAGYTVESENADVLASIGEFERSKGCVRLLPHEGKDFPLLYMAMRTNGRDVLSLLQSDATLRGLLAGINSVADADRMLGTSKGVLTLRVGAIDADWNPSFALSADNADPSVLNDADYWLECAQKQKNVRLQRTDPQTFVLTNDQRTVQFGVCNQAGHRQVYFASPSMAQSADAGFRFAESAPRDNGVLAYFEVDMRQLYAQPCLKKGSVLTDLLKVMVPASAKLVYEARTGRKGSIRVQ